MSHHAPIDRAMRHALLFFALLLTAGALPAASRATRPPISHTVAPAATINETEDNNTFQNADTLSFTGGSAAANGTIDSARDQGGRFGDWFKFTVPMTQGGALLHLTLTNLPGDYDVALLADPKATLPVSDGIDLGNVGDYSQVNSTGQVKAIGQV